MILTATKSKTGIINITAEFGKGELKPCPFCGHTPKLVHTWTAAYWVECSCSAQIDGDYYGGDDDKECHILSAKSAIAKWNTRIKG